MCNSLSGNRYVLIATADIPRDVFRLFVKHTIENSVSIKYANLRKLIYGLSIIIVAPTIN
jgi:hypothetical protein